MAYQQSAPSLIRLLEIVARLRSPGGCPWDAQQTPESLKPFLLEECYEVLEALDRDTPQAIAEELGDLLLQIILLSRIFEEKKLFTIEDVATGIGDKLVRRHPHVFAAETEMPTMEDLHKQWDEIKSRERCGQKKSTGLLSSIPKALPALARAQKVTARARKVGFDWPERQEVMDKIEEEIGELQTALDTDDKDKIEHEFGDLLLCLANLARFLGIRAETALQKAVARFQSRFEFIETELQKQGRDLRQANLKEMDALWQTAKKREAQPTGKSNQKK